jgi:hypothetical protein
VQSTDKIGIQEIHERLTAYYLLLALSTSTPNFQPPSLNYLQSLSSIKKMSPYAALCVRSNRWMLQKSVQWALPDRSAHWTLLWSFQWVSQSVRTHWTLSIVQWALLSGRNHWTLPKSVQWAPIGRSGSFWFPLSNRRFKASMLCPEGAFEASAGCFYQKASSRLAGFLENCPMVYWARSQRSCPHNADRTRPAIWCRVGSVVDVGCTHTAAQIWSNVRCGSWRLAGIPIGMRDPELGGFFFNPRG